jgi:EAL domain-containing protein (putative c-di-GMP-specific phosphodiesterase class I)/GGDEF domain-containing protein
MSTARGSMAVHRMLASTIAGEEVSAIFQPIVDLRSGTICGYEALSRPTSACPFKNVSELFDAAEQERMLWGLEAVTRRLSLDAASNWPGDTQLFLNTTPQVFADPRFTQTLAEAVRQIPGLSTSRIVLEITERAEQQYMDGLEEQVKLAKAAGFQIAIDDVGAGTSGLQRIVGLRPHWLKLDRELIAGIHNDRVKQHLVRFFLHFARMSGVRIIAEGIEEREELEVLSHLGVVFGQGYLLGRPGSRDQKLNPELCDWMRQNWGGIDQEHVETPRHAKIGRFSRPTMSVNSSDLVREVAASLLRQPSTPGVAVMEGRRFAGWCDREEVLLAASDLRASRPIGHIVNSDVTATGADTTIVDALQLAASRDERSLTSPLMLTEQGQLSGMLTVRDLLHAASDMATQVNARTNPMTGLPNLVRAEKHLADLVRQRGEQSGEQGCEAGCTETAVDLALIDIRSFTAYNQEFGYELGDELIRHLAMMINMLVVRGDDTTFTAHLNNEHFLITARPGVLAKRVEHLRRQFDRMLQGDGGEAKDLGVSLRVVVIEDVLSKAGTAREIQELAQNLRKQADHAAPAVIDEAEVADSKDEEPIPFRFEGRRISA